MSYSKNNLQLFFYLNYEQYHQILLNVFLVLSKSFGSIISSELFDKVQLINSYFLIEIHISSIDKYSDNSSELLNIFNISFLSNLLLNP